MKRIILLEEKGDVYYVVQSPIKFLGIVLFWKTDCWDIPAGGGSLLDKAIFKTLEDAKEYIKNQYKERISRIK